MKILFILLLLLATLVSAQTRHTTLFTTQDSIKIVLENKYPNDKIIIKGFRREKEPHKEGQKTRIIMNNTRQKFHVDYERVKK